MRKEFILTDEQVKTLLEACKPVPVMFLSGGESMFGTTQENANHAWRVLADELGFQWDTARPVSGKGPKYFTAEPTTVQAEVVKAEGSDG